MTNMPVLPAPGGKLVMDRPFKPVRVALLTVSDSRDGSTDTSGDILADRIVDAGHELGARTLVRDDKHLIAETVQGWISNDDIDVVISTGGTGLTGRDVTPEAVMPLFEKHIEGFAVIWHLVSYQSVGLSTLQSRACAGVSNGTFIFCLPGSNGACKDGWDKVIRWQLDSRHAPCNMVELMPRLKEV